MVRHREAPGELYSRLQDAEDKGIFETMHGPDPGSASRPQQPRALSVATAAAYYRNFVASTSKSRPTEPP